MQTNWERAYKLAFRPYDTAVFPDMLSDNERVYVAITPELPGCITHHDSAVLALQWLMDARIEMIASMLDSGLPIPEPRAYSRPTENAVHIESEMPINFYED